jgi:RimJ/RimL family protein N-acetyltransferase
VTLPVLAGERVRLRPMEEADAPLLSRWFSDPGFQRQQWGAWHGPMSLEEARGFWSRFQSEDSGIFALEHDGRTIGFANFRRLNLRHANADIGIGIGEAALWGRGLGTAGLRLLLAYLLGERGLHRIRLHVAATNDRAVASYRKCGFEVEGIEREGMRGEDGAWADMAVMGLVAGRMRPAFDPVPVVLEGRSVRLEPLRMAHAEELFRAVHEEDVWTHLGSPAPSAAPDIERYIREALDRQVLGDQLPWLTRRVADGLAVGTTRFGAIDRPNRSVELGWTILSKEARRTAANTEAKYLQLRHAFDDLGAVRVWLKADVLNRRSRDAIERLGARLEGVIRSERIMHDGRVRDAAYHSILRAEWPDVRRRLEGLLAR